MRHGTTRSFLAVRFGGLAILVAVPLLALGADLTVPDSRLGTRTAPLLLLSREDVCADLKLSPEQQTAARHAMGQLHEQAIALKGKAGGEAVEARRVIDQEQRSWLDTNLSAEQRHRLGQIDLQWEGPSALISREPVAQGLGLSEGQRQALKQAVERRNALRAKGKCRMEDERQLAEQCLAVLTAEQKSQWKARLGPALAVQVASKEGGARK